MNFKKINIKSENNLLIICMTIICVLFIMLVVYILPSNNNMNNPNRIGSHIIKTEKSYNWLVDKFYATVLDSTTNTTKKISISRDEYYTLFDDDTIQDTVSYSKVVLSNCLDVCPLFLILLFFFSLFYFFWLDSRNIKNVKVRSEQSISSSYEDIIELTKKLNLSTEKLNSLNALRLNELTKKI